MTKPASQPENPPEAIEPEPVTPEAKKSTATPYLTTLPEGWTYGVQAFGPDGAIAEVMVDDQGKHTVSFDSGGGPTRTAKAPDLTNALRTLGVGVKALNRVALQEAKATAAREAALAVLGEVQE